MNFADDIYNERQGGELYGVPENVDPVREEKKKTLNRNYLINKLNYINFQDSTITVNFRHRKFNSTISLQAKPLPCIDGSLDCIWVGNEDLEKKFEIYAYSNFFFSDNRKLIMVNGELTRIDSKGMSVDLPEFCTEIQSRRVKRHYCDGIKVQLMQNGAIFHGSLVDFSAISFRVDVYAEPPQTFNWISAESPVNIILADDIRILFASECRIMKHSNDQTKRTFVLESLRTHIRRFKPKKYRSIRQELIPSPDAVFLHPLINKTINLKLIDISGSGFSVKEEANCAVLAAGLIIPDLELIFAQSFIVKLKAQVVYSNMQNDDSGKSYVKCGLAIIDMDIDEHVKLLALLQQVNDANSYLCNKVDTDKLWNFFFETGFIYPQKYTHIQSHKEKIKELYEKLYTRNPRIARHFIYQDKGAILGHMAMIRFYENSWLIHHHAANRSISCHAGLTVLIQLSRSIIDCHSLYSAHMNYLICFFRPENRFPNRVFGGVAKHIDDRNACSIDEFAYFHFRPAWRKEWKLTGPWQLNRSDEGDLFELRNFYAHESGGLMLNALGIESGMPLNEGLAEEYKSAGFTRERYLFSLKKNGVLKAFFILDKTDLGLNMAELTNCLKIVILENQGVPPDILDFTISLLACKLEHEQTTVLLYPVSYMEQHGMAYEKKYEMFIIDTQYSDAYFEYLSSLMRLR